MIARQLEVVDRHLLHLVRRVARLERRPQRVALDRLHEDDRGLAGVVHRGAVGGVHLPVVVAAALEVPDLLVREVLDHRLGARVPAEEVVADEAAVLGLVGLIVAVRRLVHEVDQRAVAVLRQQCVPLAAPDDLDDVPAGAAEERLQLLDDLAVAADRAVEALEVAVDDEREVVELLVGRDVQHAAALRLVQLTVAQERPRVLLGGVLDAAVVQVLVELRLRDRVHGTDAHGHRGVLPEVLHLARVRVRGHAQVPAVDDAAGLLAESVQLVGA